MLDYHSTGIQKFILDRLTQIHDEIVKDDPEHQELGERPNELLKQIAAKLTPEDRKLLTEYEDNWIYQINRQDEIIYSEGLMDGMLFGYWVAMVGRGVNVIKLCYHKKGNVKCFVLNPRAKTPRLNTLRTNPHKWGYWV